jgi:hypothetical protein
MSRIRILILAAIAVLGIAGTAGATYTQQYTLATDATFEGQITVAMEQAATYSIISEATSTAGHLTRATFSVQVLQNPTKWTPIVAMLIASQGSNPMTPLTVPSTVADSLVSTAVSAQWSAIAGYYTVAAQ